MSLESEYQVYSVTRCLPSLRNSMRRAHSWLSSKRHDDKAEGLWRIHDQLYDLINFIPKHPGGGDWLRLTQGTDITELFETHHISGKARLLLSNFYVRDAREARNSRITFTDDGFYQSLKEKVADFLPVLDRSEARRFTNVSWREKNWPKHSVFTHSFFCFCSDLILDDRWHSAGDDFRPHDIVGDAQQCDSRCHRWIFARISHLSDAQFASSAWQLANVVLQFVGLKSSRVAHWPCHEPSHVHQHPSRLWGASVWAFCAAAASRRQDENAENRCHGTYTNHLDVFH